MLKFLVYEQSNLMLDLQLHKLGKKNLVENNYLLSSLLSYPMAHAFGF